MFAVARVEVRGQLAEVPGLSPRSAEDWWQVSLLSQTSPLIFADPYRIYEAL